MAGATGQVSALQKNIAVSLPSTQLQRSVFLQGKTKLGGPDDYDVFGADRKFPVHGPAVYPCSVEACFIHKRNVAVTVVYRGMMGTDCREKGQADVTARAATYSPG